MNLCHLCWRQLGPEISLDYVWATVYSSVARARVSGCWHWVCPEAHRCHVQTDTAHKAEETAL